MTLRDFLHDVYIQLTGELSQTAWVLRTELPEEELNREIGPVEQKYTRSPGVDLGKEFVETDIPGIRIGNAMWGSRSTGWMFKGKPNTQYRTCIGTDIITNIYGVGCLTEEETVRMPEEHAPATIAELEAKYTQDGPQFNNLADKLEAYRQDQERVGQIIANFNNLETPNDIDEALVAGRIDLKEAMTRFKAWEKHKMEDKIPTREEVLACCEKYASLKKANEGLVGDEDGVMLTTTERPHSDDVIEREEQKPTSVMPWFRF